VRALTRDPVRAAALKLAGVEFVTGDLERPVTLNKVVSGVTQIFLATTADTHMAASHGSVIDALRRAGTRRIVRVSYLGAARESPVATLRWHREVEEQIERSGLAWTHLRPSPFMQHSLSFLPGIRSHSAIYACARRGRISFVDARDVSTVAVKVLLGEGHDGKAYEVTGPEALSLHDVADRIGTVIRRQVVYVDQPSSKVTAGLTAAGVPEWEARDIAGLYELAAQGQFSRTTDVVHSVTGGPPANFDRFVEDYAGMFRGM
jgi:uncharacterized protein YbjT (DUF2867 family)